MDCTPELAASVERAEGRLCADIARCVAADPQGAHVLVEALAGGLAVFTRPGSPVNRLIGLGFAGLPPSDRLDRIEAHFASQGADVRVEFSTLAQPVVGEEMLRRGYRAVGTDCVLGHPLRELADPPANVCVTSATADEIPDLADALAAALAVPDDGTAPADYIPPPERARRWLRLTLGIKGVRGYAARLDGQLAGTAMLKVAGDVALLIGAGTLPAFRRRGVQTALLRMRLRDAARAGCAVAVVVTPPTSKSRQNAEREGFSVMYDRRLLVKAAPQGTSARDAASF